MKHGFTNGSDAPDDQRKRHYDVFEEVTLIAHFLARQGVLAAIEEQVRFVRRRFGRYEVIDFVAVLAGLCGKLRADAGSLLRAAPALGKRVYGALRA